MKTWFPFTDYDFYAYLTSGSLLIAAVDLAINSHSLLSAKDWSVVATVVFFAGAYVTGHLVAWASAQILEHGLAREVLAPPAVILLALKKPSALERQAAWIIGRCYEPLSEPIRQKIIETVASAVSRPAVTLSAEDVFQIAHRSAITTDHVRDRVADFRNQYGFCRNVALVAGLSALLFSVVALGGRTDLWSWAVVSTFAGIGMTARFLKFYSAFTAEVLRTLVK